MKRLYIAQLIPGMVTADDIFSYNGQLLIPKDTVLTDNAITLLQMYDIVSIRVQSASAASDAAPAQPYLERIKNSAEFQQFKTAYTSEIEQFSDALQHALVKDSNLDTDELLGGTLALMDNVHTATGVFDMLHCMREYDDPTFGHSINVALICYVAAQWLDMPEEDARMAASCGLFHDIGKLQIPKSILGKPARLTADEYDIIKKHPAAGYRLLQERGMNEHICNAALMHHERCDGSGYPLGLTGPKLDRFAKLVSIADVYDATTASRVYRGPLCPFTVIHLFEQEGLQKYEPQYIMTFLENVVNTYIATRCRLNNGQEGDIIYINKDKLSRPVVKCGDEYVDLAARPDLVIECLL